MTYRAVTCRRCGKVHPVSPLAEPITFWLCLDPPNPKGLFIPRCMTINHEKVAK